MSEQSERMKVADALLECPHCGSPCTINEYPPGWFYAHCPPCGSRTDKVPTLEGAVQRWNMRRPTPIRRAARGEVAQCETCEGKGYHSNDKAHSCRVSGAKEA